MGDNGGSATTGIEIPGTRDGYRETDRGVSSEGPESGGLATPPNTPLSTSLNPNNNSLLSKSWFAEQFHRQMMIHNTQHSGLSESTERVPPSTANTQSAENADSAVSDNGRGTGGRS